MELFVMWQLLILKGLWTWHERYNQFFILVIVQYILVKCLNLWVSMLENAICYFHMILK